MSESATTWWRAAACTAATFAIFACGGDRPPANAPGISEAAPSVPPPAVPDASVGLFIAPMKLLNSGTKNVQEVKADGSVLANGKPVGRIVGSEFHDLASKALIAVAPDGSMTMAGASPGMKFNEKDELVFPDGARFVVDDTGEVTIFSPQGKAVNPPGQAGKFVGFKPEARRTAVVLVLGLMAWDRAQAAKPRAKRR